MARFISQCHLGGFPTSLHANGLIKTWNTNIFSPQWWWKQRPFSTILDKLVALKRIEIPSYEMNVNNEDDDVSLRFHLDTKCRRHSWQSHWEYSIMFVFRQRVLMSSLHSKPRRHRKTRNEKKTTTRSNWHPPNHFLVSFTRSLHQFFFLHVMDSLINLSPPPPLVNSSPIWLFRDDDLIPLQQGRHVCRIPPICYTTTE